MSRCATLAHRHVIEKFNKLLAYKKYIYFCFFFFCSPFLHFVQSSFWMPKKYMNARNALPESIANNNQIAGLNAAIAMNIKNADFSSTEFGSEPASLRVFACRRAVVHCINQPTNQRLEPSPRLLSVSQSTFAAPKNWKIYILYFIYHNKALWILLMMPLSVLTN